MPLLFGDGAEPLYGVYHAPAGRALRCAAVLVNPFGHEALRAHRAFRQLATQLARDGMPVLRFDYRGTGDSSGDAPPADVAALAADVGVAADEVRDLSDARHVVLCGLRLGADAVLAAAPGRRDVRGMVLWDPVADGRTLTSGLPVIQSADGTAIGGFACDDRLLAAMRDIGHAPEPAVRGRVTVVVAHDARADLERRATAWAAHGATVEYATTSTRPAWDAVDADGSIVLPAEALQIVADTVMGLAAGAAA
jgi:uncharacterized protein